jgi:hypothetical protein
MKSNGERSRPRPCRNLTALTRVVRVPPVCETDRPSSPRSSPWLSIVRSSSLHIEPRNPVLLRPAPGLVFCLVRSWWPSLVSYFPTPQKKLRYGSGAKSLAKGDLPPQRPSLSLQWTTPAQAIGGKSLAKRRAAKLVSVSSIRHEKKPRRSGAKFAWDELAASCLGAQVNEGQSRRRAPEPGQATTKRRADPLVAVSKSRHARGCQPSRRENAGRLSPAAAPKR